MLTVTSPQLNRLVLCVPLRRSAGSKTRSRAGKPVVANIQITFNYSTYTAYTHTRQMMKKKKVHKHSGNSPLSLSCGCHFPLLTFYSRSGFSSR
jgi:hypothetical protein